MDHYRVSKVIGKGSYGEAVICRNTKDGVRARAASWPRRYLRLHADLHVQRPRQTLGTRHRCYCCCCADAVTAVLLCACRM